MEEMKKSRIIDYLKENVDVIGYLVTDCNSWNGSLEDYDYWENGEDFFNTFFEGRPMEVARATYYGDYNFMDDYVRFNAYGNLKSCSEWEREKELQDDVEYIFDTWYGLYEENSVEPYDNELRELLES